MSLLDIITVPAPILKETARPVARVDDTHRRILRDMVDTMMDAPGIGLAANQVNLGERLIVCNVPEGSWEYAGEEKDGISRIIGLRQEALADNTLMMANPEILWRSEEKSVYEEGCLSLPGQYADVVRPARVRVRYLDPDNIAQEIEAAGLFSHCLQHEIDHLNGVLFVDYLSSLKRDMMIRKVSKIMKGRDAL